MSATWQAERLKFVVPSARQILPSRFAGTQYIGLENIQSGTGKLLLETEQEQVDSSVVAFDERSVLFGKLRPYLAKVATPDFRGVASTEIRVFEPAHGNDRRFLSYSLLSDEFIKRVSSMVDGAKMQRANPDDVLNLRLAVPPPAEQRRIAGYPDEATGKVDRLVALRRRQMELLREQRAALMQPAVTRGLNRNAPSKTPASPGAAKSPSTGMWSNSITVFLSDTATSSCRGTSLPMAARSSQSHSSTLTGYSIPITAIPSHLRGLIHSGIF